MTRIYYIFGYLLCGVLLGCIKAPDYDDSPSLTFVSISKSTMVQGDFNTDSITLILDFTDGDGDIGAPGNSFATNLFVYDNRSGDIYDNIKLPLIPQKGANNGVEGTIFIKLYNACCLFDDRPNCTPSPDLTNEFTLGIELKDNAGNVSNRVTTSPITLICL